MAARTQDHDGSPYQREIANDHAAGIDAAVERLDVLEAINGAGGEVTAKSLLGKPDAGDGPAEAITAATANTVPLYDGTSIAFAKLPATAVATADSAKVPGTPTLAVGAPTGDVILVTITLKDLAGTTKAAASKATVWLSDTAGAAPSAVAPDGGASITTGTLLKEVTADVLFEALSDTSGVIVVTAEESTAKNYYVNVAYGGVVASSAVVAFTG